MSFHDLDLSERRLIARRGTALFAQRLAELSDDDLEAGSLLDGWTRKHLVAHVGYNAAALCRLMDWAATGV
jgi:maleylpyruvate isomerase